MAKSPASIYPPPATKGANGDLIDRLTTDGNGNLNINIAGGGGSGGTAETDETPFVAGITAGTPVMGEDPTSGEVLVVALSPGTRKLLIDDGSLDETVFSAGVNRGQPIMAYDPTSGDLLICETTPGTRKLAVDAAVTVTPVESNTASAAGPVTVGTSPVTLLAANASRKRLTLQNVGTTRMLILFGVGVPSSSNYHIALPAGGVANDGSSPVYIDTMWTGAVQAIGSAAGGEVQAYENT